MTVAVKKIKRGKLHLSFTERSLFCAMATSLEMPAQKTYDLDNMIEMIRAGSNGSLTGSNIRRNVSKECLE